LIRQRNPARDDARWGSRIVGVVLRPRSTFNALIHEPSWVATWLFILIVWLACGGWLLSTEVGQQALVDERVRVVESLGGTVSDAEYAALQASPPWWVYFTSGGRLLLLPLATLVAAALVMMAARMAGHPARLVQALSIVVHASSVLALGQVLATPLHYVRESLTSPLNLAAILPLVEDGTLAARFFGTVDLFAAWWAGLVAIGLAALTGQPARRYLWRIAVGFIAVAAITATIVVAMGGA
jgi:hypothetical protein